MVSEPQLSCAKSEVGRLAAKDTLLAAAAVVAASPMLFLGTGLHPPWVLTLVSPLPILLISPRLGRWNTLGLAALSWFLGSLNMWRYLLNVIRVPLPLVLVFSVVLACLFGLAVLLFRQFIVRGSPWGAALALPTF